jgi:hypothetical protein
MEGEKYILSSSLWAALLKIENVLAVNERDSPVVAAVRSAMHTDHFNHRVTLEKSIQNPLHVLMHLLDHRSVVLSHSSFAFHRCCSFVSSGGEQTDRIF